MLFFVFCFFIASSVFLGDRNRSQILSYLKTENCGITDRFLDVGKLRLIEENYRILSDSGSSQVWISNVSGQKYRVKKYVESNYLSPVENWITTSRIQDTSLQAVVTLQGWDEETKSFLKCYIEEFGGEKSINDLYSHLLQEFKVSVFRLAQEVTTFVDLIKRNSHGFLVDLRGFLIKDGHVVAMAFKEEDNLLNFLKTTPIRNMGAVLYDEILYGMILCVRQLHSTGYAHNNISLESFTIDTGYGNEIKLKNLESATVVKKVLPKSNNRWPIQPVATGPQSFFYWSPAKLKGEQHFAANDDIWALGIAAFTLAIRDFPFKWRNMGPNIVKDNIIQSATDLPGMHHQSLRNLLLNLMNHEKKALRTLNAIALGDLFLQKEWRSFQLSGGDLQQCGFPIDFPIQCNDQTLKSVDAHFRSGQTEAALHQREVVFIEKEVVLDQLKDKNCGIDASFRKIWGSLLSTSTGIIKTYAVKSGYALDDIKSTVEANPSLRYKQIGWIVDHQVNLSSSLRDVLVHYMKHNNSGGITTLAKLYEDLLEHLSRSVRKFANEVKTFVTLLRNEDTLENIQKIIPVVGLIIKEGRVVKMVLRKENDYMNMNLHTFLDYNYEKLRKRPSLCVDILAGMTSVVGDLHKRGFVNNNLSLTSFAVTFEDTSVQVRLVDLKLASPIDDEIIVHDSHMEDAVVREIQPFFYYSPKKLRAEKHSAVDADIWALGVISFFVVIHEFPFVWRGDLLASKIQENIIYFAPDLNAIEHPSFKAWLLKMMNVEPKEREALKQITADPFIIEKWNSLEIVKRNGYFFAIENNSKAISSRHVEQISYAVNRSVEANDDSEEKRRERAWSKQTTEEVHKTPKSQTLPEEEEFLEKHLGINQFTSLVQSRDFNDYEIRWSTTQLGNNGVIHFARLGGDKFVLKGLKTDPPLMHLYNMKKNMNPENFMQTTIADIFTGSVVATEKVLGTIASKYDELRLTLGEVYTEQLVNRGNTNVDMLLLCLNQLRPELFEWRVHHVVEMRRSGEMMDTTLNVVGNLLQKVYGQVFSKTLYDVYLECIANSKAQIWTFKNEYHLYERLIRKGVSHPNLSSVAALVKDITVPNLITMLAFPDKGVDYYNFGTYFPLYASKLRVPGIFRNVLLQILGGVEALHNAGVAHHDIKLQNVVFDYDEGNGTIVVTLIDIGNASLFNEPMSNTEINGTSFTLSPEYITKRPLPISREKIDIWAVAMVFFEIATGATPFSIKGGDAYIMKRIISSRPDFTAIKHRSFLNMLELMTHQNPIMRPSAEKLKGHDFFNGGYDTLYFNCNKPANHNYDSLLYIVEERTSARQIVA